MTYFGAKYDLEKLVKTHLFLLCPNNSGSTYVGNAIGQSSNVWSLPTEGQHVMGFAGPKTRGSPYPLVWGAKEEWRRNFTKPGAYNWAQIQKSWYFQARAETESANVFFTKAPPFLMIADQLNRTFENARFIFMVRDPYAVAESICPKRRRAGWGEVDDAPELAANHILECFRFQKTNMERLGSRGVYFTYEDLCAAPLEAVKKVRELVPSLEDLRFGQKLQVKGNYDEPLRDMNEDQIMRLDKETFERLNVVFDEHQDVLKHFGYELRLYQS